MTDAQTPTSWHLILGTILKLLLIPRDINVELEVEVMLKPPRADILLLRRNTDHWTPEQLAVLPDGIRDSHAHYSMLEFKYSESINTDALLQIANNQRLYLQSNNIKPSDLKSFLISAKHPQAKTLEKFGFYQVKPGVYHSNNCLIESITLISLNELPNTSYNAWFRCFASQRRQHKKAFEQLQRLDLQKFGQPLSWVLNGLYKALFRRDDMSTEIHLDVDVEVNPDNLIIDPQTIMELGKFWEESYRRNMTVEERLDGVAIEELLQHIGTEQRLQGLAPKERMQGIAPEEFLQQLTPEQIEAYLQKIKQQ